VVPRSEVRIMFLKTLLYTTTKSEVRIIFLKTLLYTTTNWKPTQIIRSSMEPYSSHFGIPYQRRGLDTWMNAWSYYLNKTKYQIKINATTKWKSTQTPLTSTSKINATRTNLKSKFSKFIILQSNFSIQNSSIYQVMK
jgi:hypothetical protein